MRLLILTVLTLLSASHWAGAASAVPAGVSTANLTPELPSPPSPPFLIPGRFDLFQTGGSLLGAHSKFSNLPNHLSPLNLTLAEQEKPAAPAASTPAKPPPPAPHRFWDRENDWLFAAVGVSRTLDYTSTLNFRRRDRQEEVLTNAIVDNHALFASIEAGVTAASIGASYLFHRHNHHRLERWSSILHATLTTGGAIRNYSLKSGHPRASSQLFLAPAFLPPPTPI